jgi:hypothetical protein
MLAPLSLCYPDHLLQRVDLVGIERHYMTAAARQQTAALWQIGDRVMNDNPVLERRARRADTLA